MGTRGGDSIDPFMIIRSSFAVNFNSNDGSSVGSSDSVEVMLVLVEVSDVGTGDLVCALIVGGIVS